MLVATRPAGWKRLAEFDFNVQYIPGEENLLPDALSCMYTFDEVGSTHCTSEYTEYDEDHLGSIGITHPASIPSLENTELVLSPLQRSSRVTAWPVVVPAWLPEHHQSKPTTGSSDGCGQEDQ